MNIRERDQFIHGLRAAMQDLISSVSGIRWISLGTVDGNPMYAYPKDQTFDISPLAGSLVGLCEAITTELTIGSTDEAMIRSSEGLYVALRVGTTSDALVLSILCDRTTNLGHALTGGRQCAASLLEQLNALE